ncbi:MAG: protease complex subunit PrcB family protein, partial [Nitrospinota bacterium]|nr:protease complex subunit PrcB family protein [Nitrospinota bacterium]
YTSGPDIKSVKEARYNGPKARIAVTKFVNKAAKGSAEIGSGISDMLSTVLFHSNRFIVLDRQDLDAVITEQDFAASGRVSEKTAAVIGELEGADLLVMGAVTEFEPEYMGAGGIALGVVTFGASLAVAMANDNSPVGAITYKESHVAIDIKVVDAATGRIVYANSVEGRYKKWGGGVIGGVGGGWSRTGVGLGGFQNTGVEEAIRVCLDNAVSDIVKNTPTEYYRVDENQVTVYANQLLAFYPVRFPDAAPESPAAREATTVESEEAYHKLLVRLKVNSSLAPVFDWSNTRLLVVFAGEKPTGGHTVSVFKVVDKEGAIEAQVGLAEPGEEAKVEEGKSWPYDVVRMAKSKKPVVFVWPDYPGGAGMIGKSGQ